MGELGWLGSREVVGQVVGLLIGGLVLDSNRREEEEGEEEKQGRRKRALGTVWYNIDQRGGEREKGEEVVFPFSFFLSFLRERQRGREERRETERERERDNNRKKN